MAARTRRTGSKRTASKSRKTAKARKKPAARRGAASRRGTSKTAAARGRPRASAAADTNTCSGDDVLARALAHEGEEYVLGARAPLTNAAWKGPWDCAEFASWCVYQASGVVYGARPGDPVLSDAYTGFWAEDARTRGTAISIEEAARIPGALLLRAPVTGRTGHIAISDGAGGTIEAHSSRRGVCRARATGRRWDTGVLVPEIAYLKNEETVAVEPPAAVLRVEIPMLRGPRVRALQTELARRGYPVGRVDGIFGPQTGQAVQRFQADAGLNPDAEAGPETLAALGLLDA